MTDVDLVFQLDDLPHHTVSLVGSKAAALAELMQAGFPVPRGVCLTTNAFSLAVGAGNDVLTMPPSVIDALESAWPELLAGDVTVAVRSSATAEDLAEASFAGQYETILGVRGRAALEAAILTCWRSFFAAGATAERQHHHIDNALMAVLIQPLINAECAGVCFSVDPVSQNRDRLVVSAAWGLGVGVVDGQVASDTYHIRRAGFQVEQQIAEKSEQIALDAQGHHQRIAVAEDRQRAACLPEHWAQQIAQYALAAERHFGAPQDVEWAIADQKLWILQSRPITALPPELSQVPPFPVDWSDPAEARHLWTLNNDSRLDEGPVPPLEQDHVRLKESIREETCKWIGVDRNMAVRYINGRAYSRPIPLGLAPGDRRVRWQATMDLTERLKALGWNAWDYWGEEIVRATERLRAFDFDHADAHMLAEHLEDAMGARRRHNMLHPMMWFRPLPSYFDAFERVTGLKGEAAAAAAHQLLDGSETPFTRLVDRLYELAQLIPSATETQALIANPALLADMSPEFQEQFAALLAEYGERTGDGWGSETTIMTPTWREDPAEVFRMIAAFRGPNVEAPSTIRERAGQKRDAQLEAWCVACDNPEAMTALRRELTFARHVYTVLELHNHYIDQMANGQLHHAVIAAARWLAAEGILVQVDDVFWLTFNEILTALREGCDFAAQIAARKAEFTVWETYTAPPILGLPDAHLPERPPLVDAVTPEIELPPNVIAGQGASPGQFRGVARVVVDYHTDLTAIVPGTVLVAPNVGPRWTPLFPILGALVLDQGGLGQHAAATAREYGLPAVTDTRAGTQRIPDGVTVFVDGMAGRVTIEP